MKLLTLTTRYYLLLFLGILGIWSLVFYQVMRFEVFQNTDEILFNRKNKILSIIQTRGQVPTRRDEYDDFLVRPLASGARLNPADFYADTLVYEATDQEFDEYRKLTTQFISRQQPYELIVFKPRLETEEMVNTISITLISLYLVLVAGLVVVSRKLSRRLWKPFYQTLKALSHYRLDQEKFSPLQPTSIREFAELNQSIGELIRKNRQIYLNQKEFIENASHEIQTPLAIIQSKIELLFQKPMLDKKESQLLAALQAETERLSRLNKALLLLSKIENKQFSDRARIAIKPLAEQILTYFEEQAEKYAITVKLHILETAHVYTNPVLMEIVLTNLIKNAFTHNIQNGFVCIEVEEKSITVSNSGEPLVVAAESLFNRFSKQSMHKNTLGLGLSIVKSICDLHGWKVNYSQQDTMHQVSVQFST